MKRILFSGVHGVGKSFFLKKISQKIEGYDIYSASALIEKYHASTDAGYKRVKNVDGNQDILIGAIKEIQLKNKNNFILDGHLCIWNSKGNTVRIPEKFFIEVQIDGIILLQEAPNVIFNRIKERDACEINIESIEFMQKEEEKYALELSEKLKIPYMIITHGCTENEFIYKLQQLGGKNIGC